MTDPQALSTLLAVESFLLAVVSLTATLSSPGRGRVAALPVSPFTLAMSAAVVISIAAFGAALSWSGIYVGGNLRPAREVFIAAALIITILFQPIFAFGVTMGLRSKP